MDSYKPEKEQKAAMNEQELKEVAGGFGNPNEAWRVVGGLQTGWLAMRTAPVYDYNNEMRGNELYNGDRVQILSAPVAMAKRIFWSSPRRREPADMSMQAS